MGNILLQADNQIQILTFVLLAKLTQPSTQLSKYVTGALVHTRAQLDTPDFKPVFLKLVLRWESQN